MNIADHLATLGFSKNETSIYLTLNKIKRARASTVINQTKLQRSVVYPALERMVQKGLLSKSSVRGVANYSFNSPESLVRVELEKLRIAKNVSEELVKINNQKPREFFVCEGIDAIIKISDRTLEAERGDTIYFLGPSKFGAQSQLETYWKKYHQLRIERGIKNKILYDKDTPTDIVESRNRLTLCEAKHMPFGFHLPFWIVLDRDTVSIIVPGEEPALSFTIRSKKTTEGFIEYFEYIWNR